MITLYITVKLLIVIKIVIITQTSSFVGVDLIRLTSSNGIRIAKLSIVLHTADPVARPKSPFWPLSSTFETMNSHHWPTFEIGRLLILTEGLTGSVYVHTINITKTDPRRIPSTTQTMMAKRIYIHSTAGFCVAWLALLEKFTEGIDDPREDPPLRLDTSLCAISRKRIR